MLQIHQNPVNETLKIYFIVCKCYLIKKKKTIKKKEKVLNVVL